MASGKGSNAVLSYIHHFFWKYGLGEKEVDLHCDNCCGQNKNNFVLWYCAWRTIHKLHLRLGLHFLIVGHTKFGPDCYFGQFKKMLRKSDVHNLDDIAKLVDKSSKPNIPQLVGTENGHVMVECYDWQKFFQPYFRRLENIKQYQHFRFDASEPGFVFAKKQPNGEETMFQLLRDVKVLPPKDGFPILPPPGLDRDRQNYLEPRSCSQIVLVSSQQHRLHASSVA